MNEAKDIVLRRLVSGGWAGDETVFAIEEMEYVTVEMSSELAFANDEDVDEFCKIVKEMIKSMC
jgi:hypothetical protein